MPNLTRLFPARELGGALRSALSAAKGVIAASNVEFLRKDQRLIMVVWFW